MVSGGTPKTSTVCGGTLSELLVCGGVPRTVKRTAVRGKKNKTYGEVPVEDWSDNRDVGR